MLRRLRLVFYLLLGVQAAAIIAALALLKIIHFVPVYSLTPHLIAAIPICNVVLIAVGLVFYTAYTKRAETRQFAFKLKAFSIGMFAKLFFLQVANLINAGSLLATGNYLYAGLFATIVVVFIANRPAPGRFVRDLKLTTEECDIVIQPQ